MKIKLLPFFSSLLLPILTSCTGQPTSNVNVAEIEFNPQVQEPDESFVNIEQNSSYQARVYIGTQYLTMDGAHFDGGSYHHVEPGDKTVVYRGQLVIAPGDDNQDISTLSSDVAETDETYEAVKFLSCMALLPLCAITRSNVFSPDKVPKKSAETVINNSRHERYFDCHVEARVSFASRPTYTLDIEFTDTKTPALVFADVFDEPSKRRKYTLDCTEISGMDA